MYGEFTQDNTHQILLGLAGFCLRYDKNILVYFLVHSVVEWYFVCKYAVSGEESCVFITLSAGKPPVKLTPLELAVGEELTKSRKRRRELTDMSYHRQV